MKPLYINSLQELTTEVVLGSTRETRVLEFKARYETGADQQRYELRKDMASLANTWGGTLLIGVSESKDQGYSRAEDWVGVDAEKIMQWVAHTLKSDVDPVPDYTPHPIAISVGGVQREVLAITVRPFVDVCGIIANGDSFRLPVRDDFGVRYLRLGEVSANMTNAHSRRIEIALDSLDAQHKTVIVSSTVYLDRPEIELEHTARMRTYGVTSWQGAAPPIARGRLEIPMEPVDTRIVEFNARQVTIRFPMGDVSIPYGVVRDVWQHSASAIGIVLDCEIVIPQEHGSLIRLRPR